MKKKIISVLVALSCVASLASCGGSGAEKEVENLIDSAMNLNLKEVSEYGKDAKNAEETFDGEIPENLDQLIDYFAEEEEMVKENEKVIKKVAKAAHDKVKDSISYKVTGSEEEDDVTVCTVEVTFPDGQSIMTAIQNLEGEIDTEEIEDIGFDDFEDSETVDKIADFALEVIDKLDFEETTTEEIEIAMFKEDGKWYISPDECDFSDLEEAFSSMSGLANMLG